MLKANYHTHTARCKHAWGEDKEYVEQAIQAGMELSLIHISEPTRPY